MYKQSVFLIFLIVFSNSSCEEKKNNENFDDIFVPTNEWKIIKEGQKVPAGLHYRINLATGKKEAKLNNRKESDSSSNFLLAEENENAITSDEVERVLREVNKKNPEDDMPKKFRTLEEIKKELADVQLQPKSDIEIMIELFKKFEREQKKKHPDDNIIITILRDFKNLGHQIDNSNEFYKRDGFRKIIYKELNSTNIAIKQEALKLFSILAQNSPQVKVHILETGGITTLLRILNLDENLHIKNSAITALSCTLRTFPYAQNKFVEFGGLTIFTGLFKTGNMKLKLKLVTLLNDFITERQKDQMNFENHHFINIEQSLYNLSWCNYLNELLHDLVRIDINDHDSIEKCLLAMSSMINKCKDFYNKDLISGLHDHYRILAKKNEEDTADYFNYLIDLTNTISKGNTSSSKDNTKNGVKEEL